MIKKFFIILLITILSINTVYSFPPIYIFAPNPPEPGEKPEKEDKEEILGDVFEPEILGDDTEEIMQGD
ncbi:MAG: hypothetical protein WDZ41_00565 [Candidatus Babeliales bacterium]